MATPSSETAGDSSPLHVVSKPADEPHEVSESQGVLREDSNSASDQQIAESFELPAKFRLIYQPLIVAQGL